MRPPDETARPRSDEEAEDFATTYPDHRLGYGRRARKLPTLDDYDREETDHADR